MRIRLMQATSEKKSNRICRIASGRIRRIVSILLIYKEFPMDLRPGGLRSIGNSFELQEDAHYPSYPAACDPAYPVTFLLRRCLL